VGACRLEAEVELVADVVVDRARDADPAGLGETLEARRDVDAVAVDVASSMITSPRLMPIRNAIRSASGRLA
jgi:hypothetical protein